MEMGINRNFMFLIVSLIFRFDFSVRRNRRFQDAFFRRGQANERGVG
jgi:hypothetical protein